MPLSFPNVEEIRLIRSPLREVVCQVRFPPILRLAKEAPVEFQEQIRAHFPILEIERPVLIEPEDLKAGTTVDLRMPVYRFHNQGKTQTASLTADFYALSTSAYRHWTDFASDLEYVTKAARTAHEIPYATRIGLRYINFIDLTFIPSCRLERIYSLLRPELTTMLRTKVITSPRYAMNQIVAADGEDQFTLRYGVAPKADSSELGFVLDFDHYAEGQVGVEDLIARCERYHRVIYNAFRWCIRDNKLAAFEPVAAVEKGT